MIPFPFMVSGIAFAAVAGAIGLMREALDSVFKPASATTKSPEQLRD